MQQPGYGCAGPESIERFVTEQLAAWEVPGCAIAAVRNGDVVLAAGWGRRDVVADLPVTAHTLFAIGSVTKAFTATTVGALVDDGLLEWDRPLRDYVPGVRLHDPAVTERATTCSPSPAPRRSSCSPAGACASRCRDRPASPLSSSWTTPARSPAW
jgi:hypothetical protein